jgi:hypothetical protein
MSFQAEAAEVAEVVEVVEVAWVLHQLFRKSVSTWF